MTTPILHGKLSMGVGEGVTATPILLSQLGARRLEGGVTSSCPPWPAEYGVGKRVTTTPILHSPLGARGWREG